MKTEHTGFLIGAALFMVPIAPAAAGEQIKPALGYRDVLAPVLPAVVRILGDDSGRALMNISEKQSLRRPATRQYGGSGSGIIIDAEKGLVLTNNHVVEGVSDLLVQLPDGRQLPGRLRGSDAATDIALIAIPPEGLVAVALASDEGPRVGDLVFAIGYPFDLEQTVTMGIVGGLGRTSGQAYEDLIQTDANINPGSSGGALVDARGRVVGVVNASYLGDLNEEIGVNYAIPSLLAQRVALLLEKDGVVERPAVGAEVKTLTPSIVRALGLRRQTGILVTAVHSGLAADMGGLRTGDVIFAIDGSPVARASQFYNASSFAADGRALNLTVLRENARLSLRLEPKRAGSDRVRRFGAVFAMYTEQGAKGVAVIDIEPPTSGFYADEEPLAASDLVVGDIIMNINTRPVRDLADLSHGDPAGAPDVVLTVRRGSSRLLLPLPAPTP